MVHLQVYMNKPRQSNYPQPCPLEQAACLISKFPNNEIFISISDQLKNVD